MKRYWTCQRTTAGIRCRAVNASRYRKCQRCGKLRAPRRRPAHMRALDLTYEQYVELNGGEFCGICGKVPAAGERRLDRDHCHETGVPRGLLCWRCNRQLRTWATVEWLHAAAAYLERAERRAAA